MMLGETPQLYFESKRLRNSQELVDCYSSSEFESPFRSTVPLLSLVRDGNVLLQDILVGVDWQDRPLCISNSRYRRRKDEASDRTPISWSVRRTVAWPWKPSGPNPHIRRSVGG